MFNKLYIITYDQGNIIKSNLYKLMKYLNSSYYDINYVLMKFINF